MVDYSRITERVFTGAAISSAQDVDTLVAAGVTHIIDARDDVDDATLIMSNHPAIVYCWDPTADNGQHPKPVEWFENALSFAMPALAQPGNICHFHCAAGINRGPSLAYTIMRAQGFSHLGALAIIRLKRPVTMVGIAYSDDADLALRQLGWTK